MKRIFNFRNKFLKRFYNIVNDVNVFINGELVKVNKFSTVLDASNKILSKHDKIPVLCYHPILKPIGRCRICLV
jgi:NADP-reducing hydrogenase subunit HndD